MRNRNTLLRTVLLAVCLLAAGAAFGDGILVGSGSVDFVTGGAAGQLSVSGPGNVHFSQSFKAGETASFSLYDGDGGLRPDGIYSWEIAFDGVAAGDREDDAVQGESASGAFSIAGGAFVDPNQVEGGTTKDQVILDDLIVDGSICAGFDCVNGESFGFDTLRLKENNLRIKFQDTSTSASFPTRDWQLTANDTSNGGAEKFSIDDVDGGRTPFTIRAGAPTNSLFVDSSGRLGLGTGTPVVNLHVVSGNTPTLRLEQNGSSGFSAQTWDVAGNEANFFIRDASNGSTLPFRIFPGAPSNALTIAANGNVGIGTTGPAAETGLHVNKSGNVFPTFQSTNDNPVQIRIKSGSTNRRIVAQNAAGDNQSQIQLKDAGSIVFQGETGSSGVCLQYTDSDDAGSTFCTFNDGVQTCAIGTCP